MSKDLFVPRKTNNKAHQPDYGTDMRTIEVWANTVPITQLVAGANITLTPANGQGSTITIAASGGGGGGYASISGPGSSNPTGSLTQGGDWIVNGNLTTHGIFTLNGSTMSSTGTTVTIASNLIVNGALSTNGSGNIHLVGQDTVQLQARLVGFEQTSLLLSTPAGGVGAGTGGSITMGTTVPGDTGITTMQFFMFSGGGAPTFNVNAPSFCFSSNGHIYFNFSGTGWTLVA
jgi:hypothetical protein